MNDHDGTSEIQTPEIKPTNYIYYILQDASSKETEQSKDVNLDECLDPKVKRKINRYLDNLFNKRQRGSSYCRLANVSKKYNWLEDNKCKMNFMAHKSVQTGRPINICTHKDDLTDKAIFDNKKPSSRANPGAKNGSSICVNYFNQECDNMMISTRNVPALISNRMNIDAEDKRRKLHVTKIGVGNRHSNGPICVSKGTNNNSCCNEMRYINIKCNTKLQQIPMSIHSLHGKSTKNSASSQSQATISNMCGTSSFCYSSFNRNGNNLITKSQSTFTAQPSTSKRIQLQELKTYSRKSSDNSNCYLLSTVGSTTATPLEHKYLMNRVNSIDKFHKLQQNNNGTGARTLITNVSENTSDASSAACHLENMACVQNGNMVTVISNPNSNDYIGTAQVANVISTRVTAASNSQIGENMSIKLLTNHKENSNNSSNATTSTTATTTNVSTITNTMVNTNNTCLEYNSILQTHNNTL